MSERSASRGAVLIVYPFCLDHVGHGNIQRILAIARYLASVGFDIDLAYQGSPKARRVADQYTGLRYVYSVEGGARSSDEEVCEGRLNAFYSGHEMPAHHLRPSATLTTLVRGLLETQRYRAVLATYAWTASIFADLPARVLKVCDVQDIMHEHAEACHRTTGQSTTFSLPAATEAFLWRQWDVLLAITPEDQARIGRDVLPHQPLLSVRHAAHSLASAPSPGLDDVALYAASDNASNVQAAVWLIEKVWPVVRQIRPAARLRVAGLICRSLSELVREDFGIEVLGFQSDLRDEIDRCGVLVAPYLYGSGLKIKVVEATCAGKATITTTGGRLGTGLDIGRALEVHDQPDAFANALASLLGDRVRRTKIATAALAQARELFSANRCYAPIASAIDLCGAAVPAGISHGMAPGALERVRTAVDLSAPGRIVAWGNGASTRALVPALGDLGVRIDVIVDGRGNSTSTSPEQLPVVPAAQFVPGPSDLIVLSSEIFEADMWHDLAAFRDSGGYVIGLCDPRHVSRTLFDGQRRSVVAPAAMFRTAQATASGNERPW